MPLVLPRLYGRFNQTGTKTGRLSSSEPNLQNIPAHGDLGDAIRGLFKGQLVVGDYSQLEPRLMAHFSYDPVLLDVYTTGKDIYLVTAEHIFGGTYDKDSRERGISKTLVLAMGYGAGPAKVAQILTVNGFPTDVVVAKDYLRELQQLYSVFFAWRDEVIRRVKVKGYVTTLGGRHRRLKAAFQDRRNWKLVGYGERQAVNAIVQGSAGDIVRRVMVAQDCGEWDSLRLLAQVHDELVWESPALHSATPEEQAGTLAGLQQLAEAGHGFKLHVPLVFEPMLCASWADKGHGIVLPEDMVEETTGYQEDL
jgi:DNA polymerase-1